MSKAVLIQILCLVVGIAIIFGSTVFDALMNIPSGQSPGYTNHILSSNLKNFIIIGTLLVLAALSISIFMGLVSQKIIFVMHMATVIISVAPIAIFSASRAIESRIRDQRFIQSQKDTLMEMEDRLKLSRNYSPLEAVTLRFFLDDIVAKKGIFSDDQEIDRGVGLLTQLLSRKVLDPRIIVTDDRDVFKGTSLCNYFYEQNLKKDQVDALKKIMVVFQPYCDTGKSTST